MADFISRAKRTQGAEKIIAMIEIHTERPSGGQFVATHPIPPRYPMNRASAVNRPRWTLSAWETRLVMFPPARPPPALAVPVAHSTTR
jgi:hypothetical protein